MEPESPFNPYEGEWHGFDILGRLERFDFWDHHRYRVTRQGASAFSFLGSVLYSDEADAALDAKREALARVRAIIDLRSFTQGETIQRRLFDLKTSSMPRDELRHRLLGLFYTLFKEMPRSYEREAVDVQGLWMELGVSENECISELNYLTGKGWLQDSRLHIGLPGFRITPDGIDEYELRGQPASTVEVFVSYREADTLRQLQPLAYKLQTRLGKDSVFIAPRDIRAGFWRQKVWTAISLCKVMLVLIGPHWLTIEGDDGRRRLDDPEDILRLEIETAFDEGKTVIPVLFHAVEMPAEQDLPDSSLRRLSECQHYTIDPDRWNADTDELIKALKVELNRPAAEGV